MPHRDAYHAHEEEKKLAAERRERKKQDKRGKSKSLPKKYRRKK